MIEVRNLSKRYGKVVAVDDLSCRVESGRVTGFLGPNGAGKSTTMRLILGLDRPSAGEAVIDGQPYQQLAQPLRRVGALLEEKSMHGGRRAYHHLLWLAQSNRIPAARVREVLALVGLAPVARRRVKGFSLGMRQRLGIAAASLGDPPVLLFDEPVNGLDPEGIVWIRSLMRNLAEQGRTVLVSSHLMAEMAVTADHVIVIGRGRLLADTSVTALTEGGGTLEDAFMRVDDSLFATFYGLTLAQLPLVVFGVLVVGSEYSSGTVRASLLATPRRAWLYAGKLVVSGLLAAAAAMVTVAATFGAAQLGLGQRGLSPLDGDARRTIVGSWLYLSLICLFAVGVAWLLRSSALALGVLLPLLFLGSQGVGNIPKAGTVLQFLPDQAGQLIMHIVGSPDDPLVDRAYGPWTGVGILALWTAAALAGGYLALRRRDA